MARSSAFAVFFSLLTALGLMTTPAMAQEDQEAPLRLIYLNTGDSEANASYRDLRAVLEGSPQIELLDERAFLAEANELGLDQESFRQSEARRTHMDQFARAMDQADVEGLLIHDVFDRGGELQVVVVGPMGWEVADLRREISRGRIQNEQIIDLLRELFTVLVPEIRGYRRDQARQAEAPEPSSAPESRPQQEESALFDPRAAAIAEHRKRRGYLSRGITAHLGGFYAYRSMRLAQNEGPFEVNHITPLYGVTLRTEAVIATFDQDLSALEITAAAGFAPFTTRLGTESLSGQYITAQADLRYAYLFRRSFQGHVIGGVELINIAMGANPQYTGHGYFTARAGAGFTYRFGESLHLRLDGLLLPLIVSSNSGGAFGDSPSMYGIGGDGTIDIRLFAPILVSLSYGYRHVDMEYPEPQVLSSAATSRDRLHQAQVLIGYQF